MVGVEAVNWTFDTSAAALYVEFAPEHSERQQVVAPGVIADLNEHGALIGLEILTVESVDVDEIARVFGLDGETASDLKALIFQPATSLRSGESAAASAPNTILSVPA